MMTFFVGASASTAVAQSKTTDAPPERTLRERFDQPVLSLGRGPVSLLMMPQEKVFFSTKLRARFQRQQFLDRFWQGMAVNCEEGANPARETFWERVQIASERFDEEALPGWLSDRGRILILLGEPERVEDVAIEIGDVPYEGQIWHWGEREDAPDRVAFHRTALTWSFTQPDPEMPEGGGTLQAEVVPIGDLLPAYAQYFRVSNGCGMTEEQRAQQATVAWRQELWDLADGVLAGATPEVDDATEPEWSFFPAEGDATFVWMRLVLDDPVPDGQRVVALLRPDDGTDTAYSLGADDFPFEAREVAGKWIVQSGRSLPPGRYAIAVGFATETGIDKQLFAGEQILVRLPEDSLRMTKVIVADQIQPTEDVGAAGPFVVSGFEVVPRPTDVPVNAGEEFWIFYQVLGAKRDGSGQPDLGLTYTFNFKHPSKGWMAIPGGKQASTAQSSTIALPLTLPASWPAGEYKIQIAVADKRSEGQATKDVLFELVKP
jgi:GWxTD domain-containing protein